jgi:hypothetical protein
MSPENEKGENKEYTFQKGRELILKMMSEDPSNCELYEGLMITTTVNLLRSRDEVGEQQHTLEDVFEVGRNLHRIHFPKCPLEKGSGKTHDLIP